MNLYGGILLSSSYIYIYIYLQLLQLPLGRYFTELAVQSVLIPSAYEQIFQFYQMENKKEDAIFAGMWIVVECRGVYVLVGYHKLSGGREKKGDCRW